MATRTNKTAEKTVNPFDAVLANMTEFGKQDGNGENIRIKAIDAFATAIRGGNNSIVINPAADGWKDTVKDYAEKANKAYCDGQNAAAGYTVVSEASAKAYATYFREVGCIAVKAPDLVAPLLTATEAFCAGKSKKDLGGRTKLHVYYRLACEVRDTIFGRKVDGKTVAPQIILPSELTADSVQIAMDNVKERGKKADKAPPASIVPEHKTNTLDVLKQSAMETAAKLATMDADAKVIPAKVRKALALIATWGA